MFIYFYVIICVGLWNAIMTNTKLEIMKWIIVWISWVKYLNKPIHNLVKLNKFLGNIILGYIDEKKKMKLFHEN